MTAIALLTIIYCIASISSSPTNHTSDEVIHKRSVPLGTSKWDGGIVYYKFDPTNGFNSDEKNSILNSMTIINRQTQGCISFVERTDQTDYILFTNPSTGGKCNSPLGRRGGQQIINLPSGNSCYKEYNAIHEILHSLGMMHEHKRTDRTDHVTVNMDNVISKGDFETATSESSTMAYSYDLYSIMHYIAYADSINPAYPTIIPKDSSLDIYLIGGFHTYARMTILDVFKLKAFYGCSTPVLTRFKNVQTNLRVDSNSNGDAYTHTPNNGNNQLWNIQVAESLKDKFYFINSATGLYLSSVLTGIIITLPGNGQDYQKWRFIGQRIINVATNRSLDSDYNGFLYSLPPNTGDYQKWDISD